MKSTIRTIYNRVEREVTDAMAEDTILSWNVPNWITVVIMVVLGFALLGMIAKIWKQKRGAA